MSPAPTSQPAAIHISMHAKLVIDAEEANVLPRFSSHSSRITRHQDLITSGGTSVALCPWRTLLVRLPSPKEELRTLPPASLEGRTLTQHATHDIDLDNPTRDADDVIEVKPRRAKSHKRVRNAPVSKKPKFFIMRLKVIVPEPFDPKQIPDDGWTWRKYGTKPLKSSPHPRNYFRCNWHDPDDCCLAKKRVEISQNDKNVFLVTYLGRHTHNPPQKPTRVPLVTNAGDPPADIGPKDQTDIDPPNNPASRARTNNYAQGKMHSVQSTSAALQSSQAGVQTTTNVKSHDDEEKFVYDLEVLLQKGQYHQDLTAECSALENVEECSYTPRAD
eukprot:SM000976S25178  [mRNA]  locus=s976:367:2016:- [translate_table: standard]